MVMPGWAPAASGTNNQPRSVTPPSTVNPTSCRCTITPPPDERAERSDRPTQCRGEAGGSARAPPQPPPAGRDRGAALAVIVNPPVRHGVWFFSFDRMLL